MGGVTRRSLLASLMALSLLCGGLGVATASLEVVDQSGTDGTVTIYTKDEVDKALDTKGAATDVETNKAAIADLKNAVGAAGSGLTKEVADQKAAITANTKSIDTNKAAIESLRDDKLGKDLANSTFATKDALNDLTTTVNNKVDESVVEAALQGKADKATTLAGYGINDAYTKDKVDEKLDLKANAADVYTKTDADGKFATSDALTTAKTELEGKITTAKTELDGKIAANTTKITANEKAINDLNTKAATTETTLTDLSGRMAAAESDIDGLQADMATAKSDINSLKTKDTELSGKIDAEINNRITSDTALDKKIDAEINNRITSDTALDKKIDAEINNRITSDAALDKKIDKEIANRITSDTALDKKIDKEIQDRKDAIGTIAENKNYIEKDKSVSDNLVKLDAQAKQNEDDIKATNDRTGGIKRNTEGTQTTIEGIVKVDNQGNVKDVKDLSAETITTKGDAVIGGKLGVTGETTLNDKLTAKGEATFEKNVIAEKDLTVNGKLNVDKISLKNDELKNGKKHDSATTITADEISNLAKVTEQGNTTESQFTHNEKGTFNYAKDEKSTGEWKRATSNVTADGVSNKMTDSDKNTHTYYQTATESKEQLVNGDKSKSNFEKKTAEGNTISITEKDADGNPKSSLTNTQTVAGEKTSVTNKDSSSTIKQGADQIRHNVTSADGKKSSIEVKAEGITNTSKDGTITNDAKDIVNNASGNISNKSQTMDTTVTGKATESYGSLDTTVNGNETHIVKGTKTETVDGKVTENYKAGQETNVTGDQDIKVSGTQTTTATDINRNASSGMIDTIDNDYGTNTETKVAGKTTTDVSIKGTGEKGQYIRGANESRDYLIKGTLMNSETKTAEATSSEITDGTNTASTRQDAKNLAGSVTNGTETGVSGIHANDNGSVSIDSAVIDVTDGNKYSVINQKKGSIQSTVVDGTNSTVILQDTDNVTIASSNGTVGLVGKDIVNNAQDTITNTAGTSITNQVNDSKVTTDANGTTFENNTPAVSDGGATTTKINGNQITTGRVNANELGVSDKDDQGNTADFSVKAGKGIKGSVTDKDGNKTYTTVTATENSFQVQDKDGNIKNHQVNTKDKSENTITNGDKTNTVTSTADGTTFNNSKANTAFEGGTYTDTTIKGNTITTGKVTMDYADVMKDLGVHGNANITGKTTTGSLEVTGTTKTKTLNVTENATVGGTLDVTGKATFQNDVDITGNVKANSYKVGDKTYIDANGINANNQKITNVADGSISEGSKDAVNGGQLYNVKNDLEGKVNKVGANAAAMANLHPMEFDPDSKWNIAAAIGNYGSETAAALGAFYRPNDDVMVNLSTAFGTGENMVGGGVSVRLGKGGNKLSREENNALKAQVADLSARMDALLSVLNPNMSKDFPDVPENHWAYEAVSRLAGNDIVQGYPDGEFHGERTMTRYEMAEIIYNALSRGAEAERELVEEFKPELQAMAASEKATAEKAEG